MDGVLAKFRGEGGQWLSLAAGVAVLAACGLGFQACSSSTPDDRSYSARKACEDAVRAYLVAPATADFHHASGTGGPQGPWTMSGTVDSQNRLGATLTTSWTCSARTDGTIVRADATVAAR